MKALFEYRCLAAACAALLWAGASAQAGRPLSSCSEVLLVSEKGTRDRAGLALAARLEKPIDYYIGEEQAFVVTSVGVSGLDSMPDARNVVICGAVTPRTDVGRYIGAIIGDDAAVRVLSERSAVYKEEDLPGPGQLTVVVTAASDSDLIACVEARGAEIVEIIESSCRDRLRRYFAERVDRVLARKLHDAYGFTLQVPESYEVLAEGSAPEGVQLLCEGPARLLGVSWIDWDRPPALADSARLYAARSEHVWRAYDGDVMDSTRVTYRLARLGTYPAIEMSGYWSNTRSVAGGYYRTFFVYEPGEKLLWAVDLLVFAPGMPKHPLFRELYAIAETFRYE